MFVTPQKTIRYSVKNNGPGRNKWFKSINQSINLSIYQSINQSITSNIVAAWLAERAWCTQFQSSLRVIYFRLIGFQYSLLPIYFRDRPNRCLQYTKVWQKTYPISDAPLSRLARSSFAPSQNSSPPQPFLCVNRSPIEHRRYLIFSYLVNYFCTRERSVKQETDIRE